MFKKPLSHLKTSAPLRSSDRRKLRQRVQDDYKLAQEDADALVPDGIMSLKFMTHVDAQGVAYLSADGEPLWFTVGKSTDDPLLPSVYTLWKKQDLLPFVSTPAAVLPVLVGGADLMVPGVIHAPPGLAAGQLVCIRQYVSKPAPSSSSHPSSSSSTPSPPTPTEPTLSAPLAVGRLALPSNALRAARATDESNRGKAVLVVHTWRDHLWDMGVGGGGVAGGKGAKGGAKGGGTKMPPDTPVSVVLGQVEEKEVEGEGEEEAEEHEEAVHDGKDEDDDADDNRDGRASSRAASPSPSPPPSIGANADADTPQDQPTTDAPQGVTYTPAEVSRLLELALIHAIATLLGPDAASAKSGDRTPAKAAFPIPASRFYTDYIVPCRPGLPTRVVPPSTPSSAAASSADADHGPDVNSDANDAAATPNTHTNTDTTNTDPPILTPLTPKHSAHKSLSAFLRAAEKAGLVSLKASPKPAQDVLVVAVHAGHPRVQAHRGFVTEAQVAAARVRRAGRAGDGVGGGEGEQGGVGGGGGSGGKGSVGVRELWAPEGEMRGVFEELGVGVDTEASSDAHPDLMSPDEEHERAFPTLSQAQSQPKPQAKQPQPPQTHDAKPRKTKEPTPMYTAPEIKHALTAYIARARLANAGDPAYVNMDAVLLRAVGAAPAVGGGGASASSSSGKKAKGKDKDKDKAKAKEGEGAGGEGEVEDGALRWLRRDELARRVMASKRLQAWHEISVGGAGGVLLRKGALQPISVTAKTRAGRKVVTSVVGFEPFLSLPYAQATSAGDGSGGGGVSAEEMAEDLRKICAGATTVGPTLTGGFKLPSGAPSQTVTVQGKQGKAVLEYLVAKGVPKEWVRVDAK